MWLLLFLCCTWFLIVTKNTGPMYKINRLAGRANGNKAAYISVMVMPILQEHLDYFFENEGGFTVRESVTDLLVEKPSQKELFDYLNYDFHAYLGWQVAAIYCFLLKKGYPHNHPVLMSMMRYWLSLRWPEDLKASDLDAWFELRKKVVPELRNKWDDKWQEHYILFNNSVELWQNELELPVEKMWAELRLTAGKIREVAEAT